MLDEKTLNNHEPKLVRLKPYDARKGYVLRRYTYRGVKFEAPRGWYRVSADMARYLADVRCSDSETAPLAFEVTTIEGARELERKAAEARRRARHEAPADDPNPTDVTERTASGAPSGEESRARRGRRRSARA